MGRPPAKDLTERELEVMHVFWSRGEATAAEARDRLASTGLDRTIPTIANLVRGLHEKGFLRQLNAERPFVYQAVRSYEDVSGRLLGDLVQRVFRGSRASCSAGSPSSEALGGGAGRPGADPRGAGPMNDLGLTLAWLAVQVALVLAPALVMQALASRRGPTSGAWVATWSLGLVVILGVSAFVPGDRREAEGPTSGLAASARPTAGARTAGVGRLDRAGGRRRDSPPAPGRGLAFEGLRRAWARFELRAAGAGGEGPAMGEALAVVALAGSGVGLLRLASASGRSASAGGAGGGLTTRR